MVYFFKWFFPATQMLSIFIFNLIMLSTSLVITALVEEPNHGPYVCLMLIVYLFCGLGARLATLFSLITIVSYSIVSYYIEDSFSNWFNSVRYLAATLFLGGVMGQFLEFRSRKMFYSVNKLKLETARRDAVLKTVLPVEIALQLKKEKDWLENIVMNLDIE
eukprot:UN34882